MVLATGVLVSFDSWPRAKIGGIMRVYERKEGIGIDEARAHRVCYRDMAVTTLSYLEFPSCSGSCV